MYYTPFANQLLFYLSAPQEFSVVDVGESRIELAVNPKLNIGYYQLWASNEETGKYAEYCDSDKHRCIINNLRPGTNYTMTLAHCFGTRPNRCLVHSKQLAVSTKDNCPH